MTIQIGYGANTINLQVGRSGIYERPSRSFNVNYSGSGVAEFIDLYGKHIVEAELIWNNSIHKDVYAWWYGWACFRQQFAFALDSAKIANVDLDGDADSGQAVIPVNATAGISAGDEMIISNPGDSERQIIIIDSVSAGISVTATESLKFDFIETGKLRHRFYYPTLISLDEDFNHVKSGQTHVGNFKWIELLEAAETLMYEGGPILT
ncbi:MAG: hypothetical protein ACU83N_10020 [Gammaproteobacteria bacterium]